MPEKPVLRMRGSCRADIGVGIGIAIGIENRISSEPDPDADTDSECYATAGQAPPSHVFQIRHGQMPALREVDVPFTDIVEPVAIL